MDYKQYGVIGEQENDLEAVTFVGTEEVYLQDKEDNITRVELPENKEKPMLEMSRVLRSIFPGKTDSEIKELQGTKWHAYILSEERKQEIRNFVEKNKGNAKLTAAIALSILGLTACGKPESTVEPATIESTPIETTIDNEVTEETNTEIKYEYGVNLEGKTPAEVISLLQSGEMNQTQAKFYLDAYNWLSNNSQTEAWEKMTLTEEQLKEANEILDSLGYSHLEGNEVRFGFTIEEITALKLRFGHETKEDLMSILGGETVEVDKLMSGTSNEAIRKYILYLLYSDELDMNINGLNIFNEKEVEAINEIHGLWKEYKSLVKEGKDKEAKEAIINFRDELVVLANTTDPELDNAISFTLRTYLMAGNIMSNAYNYQQEQTLHVVDSNTGNTTEIKATLDVFDELTMRELELGYEGFDQNEWKKENKIAQKYVLTVDDVQRSIADMSCAAQEAKFEEYNAFAAELRNEDMIAESTWAAVNSIDLTNGKLISDLDNAPTMYDRLTDNTASIYDLAYAIDAKLEEEGKTPINDRYFETVELVILVRGINEKVHPTTTVVPSGIATVLPITPTGVTAEQAVANFGVLVTDAAEEAAAASIGVLDGNTPEEQAANDAWVQQNATIATQAVYDAVYNYYLYGTGAIDQSWFTSSQETIRNAANAAKADAEAVKNAPSNTSGGEVTYTQSSAATNQEPSAPSADPAPSAHTEPVVDPNQGEINNNMTQVEIASNTNIGNTPSDDVPVVPGDTEEVTVTKPEQPVDDPTQAYVPDDAVSANQPAPEDAWVDDEAAAWALLYEGNENYQGGPRK